jgi:hypothetical protein
MRGEPGKPAQPVTPEPMGQAMQNKRMDSRITSQDFPKRTSCRIAVKNRTDIFTQIPEHEANSPFWNEGEF